jgi:hypothetical protein
VTFLDLSHSPPDHPQLTAEEALLLADQLTRGAHLVLETGEDLPGAEREYQRLIRSRPAGDENG